MAVSKNIQDLVAVYAGKIAGITDTLDKAKAKVALDAYRDAENTYQKLLAVTSDSYSGPSMSVTKRQIDQARTARDSTLADLEGQLGTGGGGVSYVDFGGSI